MSDGKILGIFAGIAAAVTGVILLVKKKGGGGGEGLTLTTTVSPAGAGSITRAPNKAKYNQGETVVLTATPATGYTFDHWEIDGDAIEAGNSFPLMMTSNTGAIAVFTGGGGGGTTYPLLTVVVPAGGGQVTRTPDKSYYNAGETVSVTAVAASGYRFDHWELNGSAIEAGSSFPLMMLSSTTAKAVFVATGGGGGGEHYLTTFIQLPGEPIQQAGSHVTKSPDKPYYAPGDLVTLTASVPGLTFNGWYVDGSFYDSSNPTNILMLASHTVLADFI